MSAGRTVAGRLLDGAVASALAFVPAVFWEPLYDDFTLPKQALLLATGGVAAAAFGWGGWWRTFPRWFAGLVVGWIAILFVASALGLDWRGSILGYYQYRQGLGTQLAYLALFAGGWAVAVRGQWRVFLAGFAGLAAALIYTVVQAVGADPFRWWIDTSDRAFGTIGNANELSAFAVIAMGLVAFVPARRFEVVAAATWGAALFMVLEAESRSGLAAVVLFFLLLPVTRWLGRRPGWPLVRALPAIGGALAVVTAASLAAGGLEGTAARVSGEVAAREAGGSTRLALWEGTVHVILARPLTGVGPDGLHLGFPRWRPGDLGGAYQEYDLVAQSSHNAVLDTAANTGIAGLLVFVGLLAVCAIGSVRSVRTGSGGAEPDWPTVWTAMSAYGALTLVNPISLAAHALFFTMVGAMAGAALARPRHERHSLTGLGLSAPLAIAGVGIGIILPLADLRAQSGWEAFATGRFAEAAAAYGKASGLLPFERDYARRQTVALVAAGTEDATRFGEAEWALRRFDRQFGFASGDAFNLAAVLIGLGRSEDDVAAAVSRAVALNPHGSATGSYAAQVMRAAHLGGVLVFDDADRWTYVEPFPEVPAEATP